MRVRGARTGKGKRNRRLGCMRQVKGGSRNRRDRL